jgi:hypothetical protein
MYRLENLNKNHLSTVLVWSKEQFTKVFRGKHKIVINPFTELQFNILLGDNRCSKIIWLDQIRIGLITALYIRKSKILHYSYFVKSHYLNKIDIEKLLMLFHKDATKCFNYEFSLRDVPIIAFQHFQDTKYNNNKILSGEKYKFHYINKL